MIDSVLKGTGNSRFLKSAVPAGTSWADALAMLQAGTFPIDLNGINTEGFQQVGTPLNKANLLKDATAAQIGLPPSTTPDGMFQALGNTGELHVWRKTVTTAQEIPAGYKLGDAESGTAFSVPNSGSQNYVTLQYGPSITVNDGGGVSLTSVTGSVQFKQYSDVSAIYDIRNNFVKAIPNGDGTSTFDGVIFVPNDCSFKNTAGIVTFGKFYRVNAYPLTPAVTTTTYPVSTNPKAYQEGDDAKAAGYTLGESKTTVIPIWSGDNTGPFYYGDANTVAVTDDGVVSVSNGTYVLLSRYNTSNTDSLKGKYIQGYPTGHPVTSVYYIPTDATFSNVNGELICDKAQLVTGYAAIPAGTTIEYLGKLGDKARVQVVSYLGTGTYGSSNPNSLTFDFVPRAVIIRRVGNSTVKFDWIIGMTDIVVKWDGNYHCSTSITRKTLSFYSFNAAYYQMNEKGEKYYAVAIG